MKSVPVPTSLPRTFINDLLHAARHVPTVPVQRRMCLAALQEARAGHADRPGWTALFTLAYARVAQAHPHLRRAYVTLPTPHLVEYPVSVANLALERDYLGESGVFVARVKDPSALSIPEMQATIAHFQTVPIEECKDYKRMLKLAGMPRPLRRLAWWLGLNVARQRGNYCGTFGVSVYSALGSESLHPISPCTTTLTYGVIDSDGTVDVRVVYDHRVMDGATVARALDALENELNGRMAMELAPRIKPAVLRMMS